MSLKIGEIPSSINTVLSLSCVCVFLLTIPGLAALFVPTALCIGVLLECVSFFFPPFHAIAWTLIGCGCVCCVCAPTLCFVGIYYIPQFCVSFKGESDKRELEVEAIPTSSCCVSILCYATSIATLFLGSGCLVVSFPLLTFLAIPTLGLAYVIYPLIFFPIVFCICLSPLCCFFGCLINNIWAFYPWVKHREVFFGSNKVVDTPKDVAKPTAKEEVKKEEVVPKKEEEEVLKVDETVEKEEEIKDVVEEIKEEIKDEVEEIKEEVKEMKEEVKEVEEKIEDMEEKIEEMEEKIEDVEDDNDEKKDSSSSSSDSDDDSKKKDD